MELYSCLLLGALSSSLAKKLRKKWALLSLVVILPLAVFASLYLLASAAEVSISVSSIEVLESGGGVLHLRAHITINTSSPVEVALEEAEADLMAGGSEIGRAKLVGPVNLPPGTSAGALVEISIWDLEALGHVISRALAGETALIHVEARGRARALFLPIFFHKALDVEVPLKPLDLVRSIRVRELVLGPEPRARVEAMSPVDLPVELVGLNASLYHSGLLVGEAQLVEPHMLEPGAWTELELSIQLHEEGLKPAIEAWASDRCLSGQVEGSALVRVGGVEIPVSLSGLSLEVPVEFSISAEPTDIQVDGRTVRAELVVETGADPIRGQVIIEALSARVLASGSEVGVLSLRGPQDVMLNGSSVVQVELEVSPGGAQPLADALAGGDELVLELIDIMASLRFSNVDLEDLKLGGPLETRLRALLAYNVSLSVLDLWPEEPGNIFRAEVQLDLNITSPISSPLVLEDVSFKVFNTTGHLLGNGTLEGPVCLPGLNGSFTLVANSTLVLALGGVQWLANQLVNVGSVELLMRSVEADVRLGDLSARVELPDLSYRYSAGEIGFEVQDVDLATFDVDRLVVVFEIYVAIYNPFSFAVNLSRGPNGEPSLSFEFWCELHHKHLGDGHYEGEETLMPGAWTTITIRVDLPPDGAWHVINEHYDPWPPPGRVRMIAALKNGVAFIRIYEVVVKVRFEKSGISIDEPVPASVNPGPQEVGHLHERSPGLRSPEPLDGPLGLLRQPVHQPPGRIEGASLNQDGPHLLQLLLAELGRFEYAQ